MTKGIKRPAKAPGNDQLAVAYYARRSSEIKTDILWKEAPGETEDVLVHDGIVYEHITDDFEIDLYSIHEHVKNEFSSSTLKAVCEFLQQPGRR